MMAFGVCQGHNTQSIKVCDFLDKYPDIIRSPIFLHFMNRELRESIAFNILDLTMVKYLSVASLLTTEFVYVGSAIVWECANEFPLSIQLLCELEKHELARYVGNYDKIDDFISDRRRLYQHDRKRYPIYFSENTSLMPWPTKPISLVDNTTEILSMNFFRIANDFNNKSFENPFIFEKKSREVILKNY